MAGIGIEFRNLFRQPSLLNPVQTHLFSSFAIIGPLAVSLTIIATINLFFLSSWTILLGHELFLKTVVNSIIISLLMTGGLTLVMARFISDQISQNKYEKLKSSYYGTLALILLIDSLCSLMFSNYYAADMGYKAAACIFFSELTIIWVQVIYLSARKNRNGIFLYLMTGTIIALFVPCMLWYISSYRSTTSLLIMMDASFFVLIILMSYNLDKMYRIKTNKWSIEFLAYFRKYPSLLFIVTFIYLGLFIQGFGNSTFYDFPFFYANLTIIPGLLIFAISFEKSFYNKFENYYNAFLNNGTLHDIKLAKRRMMNNLFKKFSYIMIIQLLIMVLAFVLSSKLLPPLNLTADNRMIFIFLILGYFLFVLTFMVIMVLLYGNDRKGAFFIAGLFVLSNAFFSYTLHWGNIGSGMLIAELLTVIIAFIRLFIYIRHLDYSTFCSLNIKTVSSFK